MLGSTILEVVIGSVFVYLLLSLICSALQEAIEGWLKIRATNLEQGLRVLLNDPKGTGLLASIYNHPSIYSLFRGDYNPEKLRSFLWRRTSLPSYIPAANFASALIDTLVRGPVTHDAQQKNPVSSAEVTFESLRSAIISNTSLTEPMQRMLLVTIDSARGDLDKAQANIEAWFNSGMERVSGWYKRRTQAALLGLGLFVAVAFNVDSLRVVKELYQNNALRAGAVAQASAVAKSDTMSADLSSKALLQLESLELPIGWNYSKSTQKSSNSVNFSNGVFCHIPGWLLTAIAISFGAPFWFDLMNKLVALRSSIKPTDPKDEFRK